MQAQVKSTPTFTSRLNWRLIAYWAFTLFIAYENLVGAVWSFLQIGYVRADLAHLGYPGYFLNILGPGELCIAVALLVPRFPVAKEWAYAGATLNYLAALASHVLVGDRLFWILPAICVVATAASWRLRPAERRPQSAPRAAETSAGAWLRPAILLVVFAVVALLTLPKAPPHF